MEPEIIRVTPNERQKYVVVRVVSADKELTVLWGNPNIQWHKDIVDEMSNAGFVISEVLGGGWMLPVPGKGLLYVWGKSDRYGVAPMNNVREVVGDTFSLIEQEPE